MTNATIADVARRAKVSPTAVSFAVNGRSGVAEETRERVHRAARELDWRPNERARALSRSRSGAIALVMSRGAELLAADPFFPRFLAAVEAVLSERGFALLLQVVDPPSETAVYRRLAQERRVDGALLTDLRREDPRLALMETLGLPAVAVGRCARSGAHVRQLATDDGAPVEELIAHLAGLGHRRIAHVAGPAPYVHSSARREAFRAAVRRASLEPGPVVRGDFSGPGGAAATERLLALEIPPTAIVYANDLMAIAGIGVATAAGLRLPRDLSVAGFDDAPLAAHVVPALTTVRQDVEGLAGGAALNLLAALEGEEPPEHPIAPSRVIWRDSTARPRTPR